MVVALALLQFRRGLPGGRRCISSSASVPRARRRDSSSARVGGMIKTVVTRPFSKGSSCATLRMCAAPCTSILSRRSVPAASLLCTSSLQRAIKIRVHMRVFIKFTRLDFRLKGRLIEEIVVHRIDFARPWRARGRGNNALEPGNLRQHTVTDRGFPAPCRTGYDDELAVAWIRHGKSGRRRGGAGRRRQRYLQRRGGAALFYKATPGSRAFCRGWPPK